MHILFAFRKTVYFQVREKDLNFPSVLTLPLLSIQVSDGTKALHLNLLWELVLHLNWC